MSDLRLEPWRTRTEAAAFVAADAVIVGDVILGQDSSVWFGAVLRGDTDAIRVGARTNVQDGAILHVDPGFPVQLGDDVTVGHRAIVHGASVGDRTLVGMAAVLMDGVVVGEDCIVGAGALLPGGRRYPAGSLILGQPAVVVRALRPEEREGLPEGAARYVTKAHAFATAGWGVSKR